MANEQLFQKPAIEAKRFRVLVFGDTATSKTLTALQFPNVYILDLEKGTDYYYVPGQLEFDRLQSTDLEVIDVAIEELLKDLRGYKTIVFDSFTIWYQRKEEIYLKYLRAKKNNPNYALSGLDYKYLKSEAKTMINKLLSLDANLIVTCHLKKKYIKGNEEVMFIEDGVIFDGPDILSYIFDTIFCVQKDESGRNIATLYEGKDRTNKFRERVPFEYNYQNFIAAFAIEQI
jgi:hypothetical protein